jgi:uncharacterized membrane protein YtjA (UPF0391 family)
MDQGPPPPSGEPEENRTAGAALGCAPVVIIDGGDRPRRRAARGRVPVAGRLTGAAGGVAKEIPMIELAIGALIVALVAGALGFTGVAAGAAAVAKLVFGLFLFLAILFGVLMLLGISLVA